jgi:hypothetical protein
MRQSIIRAAAIVATVVAMTACGGDSTSPSSVVAGNYTATQFVTTGSSGQTNQILAGSTFTISLNNNGTTTGHLHVAASGSQPALDADMAGTWAYDGTTVTFHQSADTFVRDMPFTAIRTGTVWQLEGNKGFSGTNIQVTLTQS